MPPEPSDPVARVVALAAEHLGDTRELAVAFFAVFSRFEFALKRAGFLHGEEGESAEPDWSDFAKNAAVKRAFDPSSLSDALREAVEFLVREPPRKQVVRGKRLAWEDVQPTAPIRGAGNVLSMVRRIRNNLFHGGKYPMVVIDAPERNRKLIESCLMIMDHLWLNAPQEVKRAFKND